MLRGTSAYTHTHTQRTTACDSKHSPPQWLLCVCCHWLWSSSCHTAILHVCSGRDIMSWSCPLCCSCYTVHMFCLSCHVLCVLQSRCYVEHALQVLSHVVSLFSMHRDARTPCAHLQVFPSPASSVPLSRTVSGKLRARSSASLLAWR